MGLWGLLVQTTTLEKDRPGRGGRRHSLHGNALSLLGSGISYWEAGVSRTKRGDPFPHEKHTAPRGERESVRVYCVFFVPRAVDGGGGRPVTLSFVKPDTDWEHGRWKAWNEVQMYAVWRKPDGNARQWFPG